MEILPNGLVEPASPTPLPFGPKTLADLLIEGVSGHPDRLALIDGAHSWTYAELDTEITKRVASGQDQTSIEVASGAEFIIGLLANFRLGKVWLANADSPNISSFGSAAIPPQPQDSAVVARTSGTTGRPKQVVHSHHSVLLPAVLSVDQEPPKLGERIGTPLDLRIANVAILGPISAFVRGSTYVVLRRRHAAGLAEDIATHGVTRLFAVPTLAFDLASNDEILPTQLASLDRVVLGGSGGAGEVLQAFTDKFGVRPTLSYGMTEAPTGVVRESLDDPIGSGRGFPLPHIEVITIDGEICLRPATTGRWANTWTGTLGYLDEPERTEQLFEGGVLHTGDLGVIDDDGAVTVTGRMSDLIIRGGKNIDPIALDAQLRALDWVDDALTVGIDDDRLGQRVGVLLVPVDRAKDTEKDELSAMLASATEQPIDDVALVASIPRNELGKPIRVVSPSTFH